MIKPFVFVLMPFEQKFDDIYKLGIKETCEKLNCYCERVDEQIFEENILERIYNQITKADIVIADLSEKNPNVFYETGYAHALGKKVILLTQNSNDIPFDLKHYPHIIYDGKIIKLQQELNKRVKWFIKNPDKPVLPNELKIELSIDGKKLDQNQETIIEKNLSVYERYRYDSKFPLNIKVDIQNTNDVIFDSVLKIGILINDFSSNFYTDKVNVIQLSENEFLHMSQEFSQIFPLDYKSFSTIILRENDGNEVTESNIKVRLFTEFGTTDYPVTVKFSMQPANW